jgi:FtsP/CotA-like multicopper oxidase with cupredoxin domain
VLDQVYYLSIGDTDLNGLKQKYGDIHYPRNFPLTPSGAPNDVSPLPGEVPRPLVPVSDPAPFEGLKPVDELPYMESDDGTARDYNDLTVGFSDPTVTKISGCGLMLRTYGYAKQPYNQGDRVAKLVAPTIRIKPGQTMKFWVKNGLPTTPGAGESGDPDYKPGDEVNETNLHTHGLQTVPCGKVDGNADPKVACVPKSPESYPVVCDQSSAGSGLVASDNVLITYGPGQFQYYEVTVPADHPSGTFWYHPHHHMATAPQVSSGMAGALIVEDDKDKLPVSMQKIKEQILVFQSMLYDKNGRLDKLPEGATVWEDSGRRITINGQVAPVIMMRPGEVQRWRMISASIHEMLRVQLAGHDLNEIATDGHYLPQVDTWKASNPNHGVDLLAGYRSDVLVKASATPGVYMLTNTKSPLSRFNSPTAKEPDQQRQEILAAVVVAGDPMTDPDYTTLPTVEEMQKIAYKPPDKPENNLEQQWDANANSSAPNPDKFGQQRMQFDSIIVPGGGEGGGLRFSINGKVYGEGPGGAPTETPRELKANRIDRWDVTTATNLIAATQTPQGAHIFHIHINPFQVRRASPRDKAGEKNELVWKDSIVVPAGAPVSLWTQYDPRFIGKFVAHCHLLDHEDAGMMELMEVQK